MGFDQLTKSIASGKFSPLYYFHGDESYFIDKLTRQIESTALNPSEATFNKAVMYGAEARTAKLLPELRSFPMMAERRLVLLKEAQRFPKGEWDKLVPYLENPVDSTVFVIVFKDGKKLDGRSKAYRALKDKGVIYESKSLYENQVGPWVSNFLKEKGYSIDQEALQVLVTYLGNHLSLIESELQKIFLYMQGSGSKKITSQVVYEMINVDKDFNVFELMNTLGQRDHSRSHFIINQMMKNVKDNPPILIVNQLFQFYHKLTLLHSRKLSSENDVASYLKIHRFIARQYATAARSYRTRELWRNLTYILEADLLLKGVQPTHMGADHVLKTLVFKLLN